jgi:hypothetical protein
MLVFASLPCCLPPDANRLTARLTGLLSAASRGVPTATRSRRADRRHVSWNIFDNASVQDM